MREMVHERVRASIHLNNVGLTLLSRHYYREALQVLKDAVVTAEQSIRDCFESGNNPVYGCLENKLDKAAKLLAATQEASQRGPVAIQVVSEDSMDAPFVFDCDTFYTLRIEYDFDDRNDYDHSIHCATILMNFGVAYMICAKTSSCAATVCKYQQAAVSLWILANKSFVLHYPELVGSPKALFVSLILYRVLIPSLVNSGRLDEARECSVRFDETARLVGAWNKVGVNVRHFAPAA